MDHATLSYSLQTSFHLGPDVLQHCDKYYILYWESRYLYTKLLDCSEEIVREKISYRPIFLDGLSKKELGESPEAQIKVSFRRQKHSIKGTVLISRIFANIVTTKA